MKEVKFSPEYNCTSIWMKRVDLFEPIEYEMISLSSYLIEELGFFDEKLLGLIDWNDPAGPSPMSLEEQKRLYALAQ